MPGTRLWDICVENNYFREGFSFDRIRVERANIDTPELPAHELEKVVAREQLISRMLPLIKHPLRMFKKYSSYVMKDPRIVFKFVLKNFREGVTRGTPGKQ
jgi:hypothetical protein